MKDQKKLLQNIVKKLEGMSKIEAYEFTHKLETLLFYANNPLDTEDLLQIISSDFDTNDEVDPFHFTILPNGNFCEFKGANSWLHIYKENNRILPNWPIFETYYFKTKYAPLELLKLTKKNLLENVKGTEEELKIWSFLEKNNLATKDPATNRLLLLKV
ncbi:hypothetical protein U6A24_18870 [Aquimarina gracilis]|uniref:Uncharacterized protein n=1 Tax=Aquimarina gracilis TaxID=874422 RepID=A0ABU6A0A2_9FLAO|nr:hypothetical protein [Aquimarina gracilis]MEB3347546.1 hypothetical protein [Aquimarina gracilis]